MQRDADLLEMVARYLGVVPDARNGKESRLIWEQQRTRSKALPESPREAGAHKVRFLDVGCGFGGLLMALSPKFPDKSFGIA